MNADRIPKTPEAAQAALKPLGRRELQALVCFAKGMDAEEIGAEMGISYKTVEAMLGSVRSKLFITKTVVAAVIATKAGLV